MGTKTTVLLARKSIRSRIGRTFVIALAVMSGVSFVVGSFVLADSLRATFNTLFTELSQEVDLEVRSVQAFEGDADREPIDASIADGLRDIDGIAVVEPTLTRYAQLLDSSGDAVRTAGGPTLGVSYQGELGVGGVTIKAGEPPRGPDQVAIDKATADRVGLQIGDKVGYLTDTGTHAATLTATLGLGDTDGFAGASIVALDLETALDRFGTGGKVDAIDIQLVEGADQAAVRSAIESVAPSNTEIITGVEIGEENVDQVSGVIDAFGTGLLIFAFITAFVSAFIINNVFQITIGQRLRELALMRAVGASGKQVRRLISLEALLIGVTGTLLGVLGGIGVAKLIVILFNAAGAGFPDTKTILEPRTFVAAAIVGIGITMLSVLIPARRAAKIPPVAAMRPELGFSAMRTKRLVIGTVLSVLGALIFVFGLFAKPGGTAGLLLFAVIGALMLFLGIASVSSTIARPVTHALGWPIHKMFGVPGTLARDNVSRAPRRTSSSAAALMIGVSLMSAAAVFASSMRATFVDTLDTAVTADYIITDESFQGLPPSVARTLAAIPELDAVTPIRGISGRVEGGTKSIGAINADAFDKLVNPDIQSGAVAGLKLNEVLIHTDPASDLDLVVGDTFDVTYQNGVDGELTVAGIFADSTFGNWLIGLDTLESVSDAPARDLFVLGRLAEGFTAEQGDSAVVAAAKEFPQAKVQTDAQFREEQEGQIDQLLLMISIMLLLSVFIAVLGIAITLALGVFERTREIGLLRAVGMNRRQLRRAVRWEAVIVSTFGAIIGIVLGTFIGVVLTLAAPDDVANQLSLGQTVPIINLHFIPAILIFAILAGLVASLYPSIKASNMDVLEAIATE